MSKYRVIVPPERFKVVSFELDDLPGIAAVNSALKDFEPKVVFGWHLSLTLEFSDLTPKGMPSKAEHEVTTPFVKLLDAQFKGPDPEKPNALFLARVTWNATQELVYRIYDPKRVDRYLKKMISAESHPRHFDYRIERDLEWKLAEWHLSAGEEKA